MAEKNSAPPTSYDAFFHGLGQIRPLGTRPVSGGSAPITDLLMKVANFFSGL